jgi:glycosyltransferase involved in cell wall biosynthesis
VLDRITEVDGVLRVPPRNTAVLAEALFLVLTDRALATRLAAAGRSCAARWTWSDIAALHAQMYDEVLREADSEGSQGLPPGVPTGPRIRRGRRRGR